MKRLAILVISTLFLVGFAQAKSQLDCLFEGEVKRSHVEGSQNVIHIKFFKAEPFTRESACRYRGDVKFSQPKGVMLENLPAGATVRYRYQEQGDEAEWSFLGASL